MSFTMIKELEKSKIKSITSPTKEENLVWNKQTRTTITSRKFLFASNSKLKRSLDTKYKEGERNEEEKEEIHKVSKGEPPKKKLDYHILSSGPSDSEASLSIVEELFVPPKSAKKNYECEKVLNCSIESQSEAKSNERIVVLSEFGDFLLCLEPKTPKFTQSEMDILDDSKKNFRICGGFHSRHETRKYSHEKKRKSKSVSGIKTTDFNLEFSEGVSLGDIFFHHGDYVHG